MNIDEMIAVLTAFKEGKDIEIDIHQSWFPIPKDYNKWDFVNKTYRVPPEPKLIPFNYNDDLVGKVVKHKTNNYKSIIIAQDSTHVSLHKDVIFYTTLTKDFTFLNDKPCGKYE